MLDELHGIWARTERSPLTEMTPYAPGMQLQLQCFSPEHVRGLNQRGKKKMQRNRLNIRIRLE